MRWRTAASFAHAHAYACQEQVREIRGKSAHGRHDAPHRQGPGNDVSAHAAVCPPRNRNAADDVEEGEGKTGQQAELCVRKVKFGLDRLLEYDQQLPVYEVESVDNREHEQDVDAVPVACIRRALRRTCQVPPSLDRLRL